MPRLQPRAANAQVDVAADCALLLGAVAELGALATTAQPEVRGALEDFKCVVNALQGRARPRGACRGGAGQ